MRIRVDYTSEELGKIKAEAIQSINKRLSKDKEDKSYYDAFEKYLWHWTYCSLEDVALSLRANVTRGDYLKFDLEPEIYINGQKIDGEPKFYLMFDNFACFQDWYGIFDIADYDINEHDRLFGQVI